MYKIAVLDIDGTIMGQDNVISSATKAAIARLRGNGVPVCLCTGRNIERSLPIVEELGMALPICAVDGIVAYDPAKDDFIFDNRPGPETMLAIADILADARLYMEAVTCRRYYRYIEREPRGDYDRNTTNPAVRYLQTFEELHASLADALQVIIIGGDGELERVLTQITARFGDTVSIRDDLWEHCALIGPACTGKAEGLRRLCAHFGVDISEAVAIGDDVNDLDMLDAAGMGVAMGNAHARAKAAADYVTGHIRDDGAAQALLRFFPL